jgi:hypothetical protein
MPWREASTTLLGRSSSAGLDARGEVARRIEDPELRAVIEGAAGLKDVDPAEAGRRLGTGQLVIALNTVPFALWAAFTHPRDYRAARPSSRHQVPCGAGSLVVRWS